MRSALDEIHRRATVPEHMRDRRFDQIAAELFPEFSRSRLQGWIRSGALRVDGVDRKPKEHLMGGEELTLHATLEPDTRWQPQAIGLEVVFEDEAVLVLNKPAGLVVHPAAGHADGTLLNALLAHCGQLANLPRGGIVHRLDRETTGLMVVAKTLAAHSHLVGQLQAREVHREYDAIVVGSMTGGGEVDAPIGRHPQHRTKMAVVERGGKEAVTHYRLVRRFRDHTHIRCLLETGRTHQIRVHMAHIRYPLVGDTVYGGRPRLPKGASAALREALQQFGRQALHARRLELEHPVTGEPCAWEIPLPADMAALLQVLAEEEAS